jgi:hypothetical protein
MIQFFTSLSLLIFAVLIYIQRKTISELEEEIFFLEKVFKDKVGEQPPRMNRQ